MKTLFNSAAVPTKNEKNLVRLSLQFEEGDPYSPSVIEFMAKTAHSPIKKNPLDAAACPFFHPRSAEYARSVKKQLPISNMKNIIAILSIVAFVGKIIPTHAFFLSRKLGFRISSRKSLSETGFVSGARLKNNKYSKIMKTLSFIAILFAALLTTDAEQVSPTTKAITKEPQGPAATVVRNYITAALSLDELASKAFLVPNCMDDLLAECQDNMKSGANYSGKYVIESENISPDGKSTIIDAWLTYAGGGGSRKTFYLVLEGSDWKISDNPKRRPNAMLDVGFKDFANIKEPLSSSDMSGAKSGMIVRSLKKLDSVTMFTGEFSFSRGGLTPRSAIRQPAAGMTFVRIIFDITLESVPTVLWKKRIEIVVDGVKSATPFELVEDTSDPKCSVYGLDGLDITKNNTRLSVTFEVKNTTSEKMDFRVNGKSYGTLQSLFSTPK